MKYNLSAIREQERLAMDMLAAPFMHAPHGSAKGQQGIMSGEEIINKHPNFAHLVHNKAALFIPNQFRTEPRLVTMPGVLQQELPYTNSSQFQFVFGANANPQPTVALNNIVFPKNNVAAIYAMRFRIGYGAAANTRTYQTYGATVADGSIYKSIVQLQVETETQVNNFFLDDCLQRPDGAVTAIDKYDGSVLVNPIRLISGELGVLQVNINTINSPAALPISANAFLQVTLMIAYGQAKGGA